MNWLKKNYLAIIVIIAVIALSAACYIFRDKVSLLGNYGYLGAFLISLISSLTIILPVPGFLLLVSLVSVYNPVLIALAAATGGVIGELSGYAAGRSGRSMLRANKTYLRAEGWMKKWGIWAVMLFAFIPLVPFDVAGLAAGALRMPIWKFMVGGWIGKTAKFTLLLMLSYWGFQLVPHLFGF